MKRKNHEKDKCCLCGIETTRIINFSGKVRDKRFVCKKCMGPRCGGKQ
jgi:hypothetical protein